MLEVDEYGQPTDTVRGEGEFMKRKLTVAAVLLSLCLGISGISRAESTVVIPEYVKQNLPAELCLGPSIYESLEIAFKTAKGTIDYAKLEGIFPGKMVWNRLTYEGDTGGYTSDTERPENVNLAAVLYPSQAISSELWAKMQVVNLVSQGIVRDSDITSPKIRGFMHIMVDRPYRNDPIENFRGSELNAIKSHNYAPSFNWMPTSLEAEVIFMPNDANCSEQLIILKLFGNYYVAEIKEKSRNPHDPLGIWKHYYAYFSATPATY